MRMIATAGMLAFVTMAGAAPPAHAQPGATPPVYAPPPPRQPYVPPPYQYTPPPQPLSAAEARLLARGEITPGAHVGGGFASIFLGLGIGQGIEGRWSETGWIFTVGELASVAAIIVGVGDVFGDCLDSSCDDDPEPIVFLGVIGIVVFRVWEVADAFIGPVSHNRKVRELRARLGYPPPYYGVTPFVAPARGGDGGGVAGISLRF
jgi:hypothetical protein